MASEMDTSEFGFADRGLSPVSELFANFENRIASGHDAAGTTEAALMALADSSAKTIKAAKKVSTQVSSYMDSRVLAMYTLVEYWLMMEGDLWQSIIVPMSIALTETEVRCDDEGEQRSFREFFESVDMHSFLQQMWAGVEAYGNIFPMQFWEEGDKSLTGLSLPNPKYIVIQPNFGMGDRPMFLLPPTVESADKLVNDNVFMRSAGARFNERPQTGDTGGKAIQLNAKNVDHIHHFKFAHELYAVPPLVRAQMAISTNRMLEEMIRATIEGLKNQIILWRLTDPRPTEAARLKTILTNNRAERMMHMVWDARLDAKAILPGSVDALLANESWTRIKLDMFRKLGINVRTLSGEVSNVGQATDYDVDVQLYLARLEAPRRRIKTWLERLCKRWATAQKFKGTHEVVMAPIEMKVKYIIENVVKPLAQFGMPSGEEILRMSGFAPKATLAQMRREAEDGTRGLFRPYASFAQDTVTRDNGGNEVQRNRVESPLSEGRPEE